MQIVFGVATAAEVAYYAYIYPALATDTQADDATVKLHYKRVTSLVWHHSHSAKKPGKHVSGAWLSVGRSFRRLHIGVGVV